MTSLASPEREIQLDRRPHDLGDRVLSRPSGGRGDGLRLSPLDVVSARRSGAGWPGSPWRPFSGWRPCAAASGRLIWPPGPGAWSFWLLALEWVRMSIPAPGSGWILMALLFSLWWPGFLALTRWAVFRLQIPLLLAAPIIWVGLEYRPGLLLERISLVLPGPQPVSPPLLDPDRRFHRLAGYQPADRDRQRPVVDL